MPVRHLFVDMNAFFASVEQQDNPHLRGRPVAVIPTDAETTSCIAASYEAKAFGVRTGTPVWEARRLCPGIACVVADHRRYVVMHHRVLDAVGSVLPVDQVRSIDEVSCRLAGADRDPARAADLGRAVKAAILARAGDRMRCSVGAGPNVLLAKVAADMKKPDGLTVLADEDLPGALYGLRLQDFPGVGPRMERRLNLHGVFAARQLCELPLATLCAVWGSRVLGGRWHRLLRGGDEADPPTRRQSVSHSHVLPPELRTDAGACGVLVRLTHKAAARLRRIGYWAGAVSVGVSFRDDGPPEAGARGYRGWDAGCRVPHCQDTPALVRAVARLWAGRPAGVPKKVGMVLSDLKPARCATPSLFPDDRRAAELSRAMDQVNAEFGASVVHLGSMHGYESSAPTRVAFTRIPDFDRRVS
ncbi:MAG: DNA polymerase [Isosphaera sp.]|nr:DNA polymerase [Isosphaera sp.]